MKHVLLSVIFGFFINISLAQKKIIVAKDGTGNYTTLQTALDAVPEYRTRS